MPLIEASLTLTLDGVSNDLVPYVDTQHYPRVLIAVDSRTITGKPTVAAWQATLIWQEVHGQDGTDISRIRQDALSTFDRVYNYLTTRLNYTPGTKIDGDTRYFTDGQQLVYYASIITVSAKVDTDMCCDGPYTPIPVPPTQSFCAAVRDCVGSLYDRVRALEDYIDNICENLEAAGCGGGGECDGTPVCDLIDGLTMQVNTNTNDIAALTALVARIRSNVYVKQYRWNDTVDRWATMLSANSTNYTTVDSIRLIAFFAGADDIDLRYISAIGLLKSTSGAVNLRFALYTYDSGTGEYTLVPGTDSGLIAANALGLYEDTPAANVQADPGTLYYLGFTHSASISLASYGTSDNSFRLSASGANFQIPRIAHLPANPMPATIIPTSIEARATVPVISLNLSTTP